GPQIREGMRDALHLLLGSVAKTEHLHQRAPRVTVSQLREAVAAMSAVLEDSPTSLLAWVRRLRELEARAESLVEIAHKLCTDAEDGDRSEILAWAAAVRGSVRS